MARPRPEPPPPWLAGDELDASFAAAEPLRPGVLPAARSAARGFLESFALFAVLNLLFVLAALLVAAAFTLFRPAILLGPLIALPASALMRAAVEVARGDVPGWSNALAELPRRAGRKLLVASAQLLVAAVSGLNLAVAASIGGIPALVGAGIGAAGLIVSSALGIALWPIVCDPRRDGPLRRQLRLALGVVVLRPIQVLVLLAFAALAVTACLFFIVPLVLLPALVMLLIGAFVVPSADAIEPPATSS